MLFQGFKGLFVVRNCLRPEIASFKAGRDLKLSGLLAIRN